MNPDNVETQVVDYYSDTPVIPVLAPVLRLIMYMAVLMTPDELTSCLR